MIKKIIKILSIIFLLFVLIIFYLSFVGLKTKKFNEKIESKILNINKEITLDLIDVKFILNPYNFTVSVNTKDPVVLLGSSSLKIKEIKTNISLKSLIFNEFSVDDLQISTKSIKLDNLVSLARSFGNSTELFLVDRVIKDGFLTADVKLRFDDKGNIKKNYHISGFVKNVELNFLNQVKTNNLSLEFDIQENKYSLMKIEGIVNEIKLISPLIKINKKKDHFLIAGKILSDKTEFNRDLAFTEIRAVCKDGSNVTVAYAGSNHNDTLNWGNSERKYLNGIEACNSSLKLRSNQELYYLSDNDEREWQ